MDIYKNSRDAGFRTVPWKRQYVRGGYIFTCPECGMEIDSHSYLAIGYWEKACYVHIEEEHENNAIH